MISQNGMASVHRVRNGGAFLSIRPHTKKMVASSRPVNLITYQHSDPGTR
ncbi:MAG: hypothetical protein Ct9H300mP9_4220 [Candidatus Neomarinimicrobiota bacterium]|nr:MAG: hypothetical protein Ct9H300mP9_4220 [Candidatus Neomarinimicrobiota bacterium]